MPALDPIVIGGLKSLYLSKIDRPQAPDSGMCRRTGTRIHPHQGKRRFAVSNLQVFLNTLLVGESEESWNEMLKGQATRSVSRPAELWPRCSVEVCMRSVAFAIRDALRSFRHDLAKPAPLDGVDICLHTICSCQISTRARSTAS